MPRKRQCHSIDPKTGEDRVEVDRVILSMNLAQTFQTADFRTAQLPAYADYIGMRPDDIEWPYNCPAGTRLDVQSSEAGQPDYRYSFSVDPNLGIVSFSGVLRKTIKDDNGRDFGAGPADVWLTCAVQVRHPDTWIPMCYSKVRAAPGGNALSPFVLPIRRDDIQRRVITRYSILFDGTGVIDSIDDNRDECSQQAEYYLNAWEKSVEAPQALTRTYIGIWPIDLDGAIQQVSYTVGKSGADTKVSRGTEHDFQLPSYKEASLRVKRSELALAAKTAAESSP